MKKKPDWVVKNDEQLNKDVFAGYEFIPKVLRRTSYYQWEHIKVDGNSLTIENVPGVQQIHISWSYNEQKIYFTSGVLGVRTTGDQHGFEKCLEALDLLKPVFDRMVSRYEL